MKSKPVLILFVVILFILAFGNNISAIELRPGNDQLTEKGNANASYWQGNDVIGEWQLTLSFYDADGDNKIEEAEKKNAYPNAQDYLKLNGDGTCLFYINKLKGRYEIKSRSSGKKYLYLFDKDNNKESRGEIISVSKTELILLSPGGTFNIYKKV